MDIHATLYRAAIRIQECRKVSASVIKKIFLQLSIFVTLISRKSSLT